MRGMPPIHIYLRYNSNRKRIIRIRGITFLAAQVEKVYRFENAEQEIGLVGAQDSNLKLIEEGMHVALSVFGDQLTIKGEADAVDAAEAIVAELAL